MTRQRQKDAIDNIGVNEIDRVSKEIDQHVKAGDNYADSAQFGKEFQFDEVALNVTKQAAGLGIEVKKAFDRDKATEEVSKAELNIYNKIKELDKVAVGDRLNKLTEIKKDQDDLRASLKGMSPEVRDGALKDFQTSSGVRINKAFQDTVKLLAKRRNDTLSKTYDNAYKRLVLTPEGDDKQIIADARTSAGYSSMNAREKELFDKELKANVLEGKLQGLMTQDKVGRVQKFLEDPKNVEGITKKMHVAAVNFLKRHDKRVSTGNFAYKQLSGFVGSEGRSYEAVSYTHLTLPTICSV